LKRFEFSFVVQIVVAVPLSPIVPAKSIPSHHPKVRRTIPCGTGERHVTLDLREVDVDEMQPVLLEEVVHQGAVPRAMADVEKQFKGPKDPCQLHQVLPSLLHIGEGIRKLHDKSPEPAMLRQRLEQPVNGPDVRP